MESDRSEMIPEQLEQLAIKTALEQPYQKQFFFPDPTKTHYVWRVEYRVQFDDGTWQDWSIWRKRPNVFLRKADAEKRLKKIVIPADKQVGFKFEFAARPMYVGYDVFEVWKETDERAKERFERAWAEGNSFDVLG